MCSSDLIGAGVARNRLGVADDGPEASGLGLDIRAGISGRNGTASVGSLSASSLSASAKQKATVEAKVVATSAANECLYCVVAHGAILRIYEKKPLVADQVAVNHRKADISPRQRAMLDFAMKVCLRSQDVNEEDFAAVRAHGFSDEDIWDITAITGFFGLSNRLANVLGIRPNDEFYLMGRVPRAKKEG